MLKTISADLFRLFSVSGSNTIMSVFNLTGLNVNNLLEIGEIIRLVIGIVGAGVAITYGFYQIKLIRKKLKEK